jgi:TetR/AcrR family transcriptional repressor of nem operon
MTGAKEEQWDATHARILDAARRFLRTRGMSSVSIGDVMGAVGLTKGGFYAHFASKTALFDEALGQSGRPMWHRLFEGLSDVPAKERALLVLKRYLSRTHRAEREEGCPLPAVMGDIAGNAQEHRATLERELRAFADDLATQTALPRAEAKQAALGMLAVMVGGLSLARALDGTPLSDEILKASRAFGAAALSSLQGSKGAP